MTVELPKLKKTLAEVKDTSDWILFTIKNIGSMEEMSQCEYLARYMWEVDQRSQIYPKQVWAYMPGQTGSGCRSGFRAS